MMKASTLAIAAILQFTAVTTSASTTDKDIAGHDALLRRLRSEQKHKSSKQNDNVSVVTSRRAEWFWTAVQGLGVKEGRAGHIAAVAIDHSMSHSMSMSHSLSLSHSMSHFMSISSVLPEPPKPPPIGVECSCTPTEYTFVIDASKDCSFDTVLGNPGIGSTYCFLGSTPVTRQVVEITSVQFVEFDTSGKLNVINQDDTYATVSEMNGATFTFKSISSELNSKLLLLDQLDKVPGGIQITVDAKIDGVIYNNRVAWNYSNRCGKYPIADTEGVGWVGLHHHVQAAQAFCPSGVVTSAPVATPVTTNAPIAVSVTTVTPSVAPHMSMLMSHSLSLSMLHSMSVAMSIETITTDAPVTSAPVTSAPVTSKPVTSKPVTSKPVTSAPVTSKPVTDAPHMSMSMSHSLSLSMSHSMSVAMSIETITTEAPVTSAPVTSAPVTSKPVTSKPVTSAPVTSAPVTDAPHMSMSMSHSFSISLSMSVAMSIATVTTDAPVAAPITTGAPIAATVTTNPPVAGTITTTDPPVVGTIDTDAPVATLVTTDAPHMSMSLSMSMSHSMSIATVTTDAPLAAPITTGAPDGSTVPPMVATTEAPVAAPTTTGAPDGSTAPPVVATTEAPVAATVTTGAPDGSTEPPVAGTISTYVPTEITVTTNAPVVYSKSGKSKGGKSKGGKSKAEKHSKGSNTHETDYSMPHIEEEVPHARSGFTDHRLRYAGWQLNDDESM